MSQLPGLLGEIEDLVGQTVALKIAAARGGQRVDIPARARPDHWLVVLVGQEIADQICEGLRITDADGRTRGVRHEVLPLGPMSVMRHARRKLVKALEDGATIRQAAAESGLHERTAKRARKALKGDQDSLF